MQWGAWGKTHGRDARVVCGSCTDTRQLLNPTVKLSGQQTPGFGEDDIFQPEDLNSVRHNSGSGLCRSARLNLLLFWAAHSAYLT